MTSDSNDYQQPYLLNFRLPRLLKFHLLKTLAGLYGHLLAAIFVSSASLAALIWN